MFVSQQPCGAKRKTRGHFELLCRVREFSRWVFPLKLPAAAWRPENTSACTMTGGKRNVLLQRNHPGEEAVRYIPCKPVIAKREHLPAKGWNALHVIGDRRVAYTRQ